MNIECFALFYFDKRDERYGKSSFNGHLEKLQTKNKFEVSSLT